jgi:cytochrome c5
MKNLNRLSVLAIGAAAFVFSILPVDAFSQKKTPEQTVALFSDPLAGIFKSSCVGCHSDQSRGKAKEFMNLSEWDKLTVKQQAKTGKQMTKQVKKGLMPPAGFLEKVPNAALSEHQKMELLTWAKSIKKNGK